MGESKNVFDHIHKSAIDEDGSPVPLVDFDFAGLDPQNTDTVPVTEASSALCRVLSWITGSDRNFTNSGGRASALTLLLGLNDRHRSLAQIARECDVSRASVSKWLLGLRDEFGIGLSMRGSLIRENCRQAQLAAIQAGRHSSVTRKTPNIPDMNAAEIREKFRTLDSARAEIERLQNPGNSSSPRTASKAPSHAAPQLEDLTSRELSEAMDLANAQGDSQMVRTLYAEIQKRRNL